MPSPVGHGMIGLSIGLLYAWPRGARIQRMTETLKQQRVPLFLAVLLANLPDVDYVPGILTGDLNAYHHQYTHTLGWVLLVTGGVWLIWRAWRPETGMREAVFVFACLMSHLVADWFTDDGAYPFGIMLWWPFSADYTIAPQHLFPRPIKEDWAEVFTWHNVRVMGIEFLITLPLIPLVLMVKRILPSSSRRP